MAHRTLFLASRSTLRSASSWTWGTWPRQLAGAIVFNVAIDTDFPGHVRFDGSTLVARIPMRFQRRGGRKRIVAPDGIKIVPATKPQPEGTLLKVVAH